MKFIRPVSLIICTVLLSGCVQPGPNSRPWLLSSTTTPPAELPIILESTQTTILSTSTPAIANSTPVAATTQTVPAIWKVVDQHTVQFNENLTDIAAQYNIDVEKILEVNPSVDPNSLQAGQIVNIPAPQTALPPSEFIIIPDLELVNGPTSLLDMSTFVEQQGGYLSTYSEEVEGEILSGSQIVIRVATEYSVNPRLLLALLEYQSGWVTQSNPAGADLEMPMGLNDVNRLGLFRQLSWAANQLNRGYYLWQVNGLPYLTLIDGNLVSLSTNMNAGTAGVQALLSLLLATSEWQQAVSQNGVYAVYQQFFGPPQVSKTAEPIVPTEMPEEQMQLPFEPGVVWSFTSGPHSSWGDGSAWGALDFAPPDSYGCNVSAEWVTAMMDGVIVRSEYGAVVEDLDGDGLEQTGWTILYMHLASWERIPVGTEVKAGDRLGHASCEGGYSTGSHVHIARRYNGQWISADGDIPFNLDGWISSGDGFEYNGTLTKGDRQVIAWEGRIAANQIER